METSFIIKQETVEFSGGTLVLRGINFLDTQAIIAQFGEPLRAMYDSFKETGAVSELAIADLVGHLMQHYPEIAAQFIAVAAGAPDRIGDISRLPFPVMLEALEKAARLTFETEGSLKKALETVIRMMIAARNQMETLMPTIRSEFGSGDSAKA